MNVKGLKKLAAENEVIGKAVIIEDFTKSYETAQEMFESPEWAKIWEGWQGRERRERVTSKHFVKAYVVPCDPELNYGQDFKLYYTVVDAFGLKHLHEASVTSGLTDWTFSKVEIEDNSIIFWTSSRFQRNKRAELGSKEMTVTLIR